ncbi:hypothetical protein [Flavobacterium pallidum]|uniref:DUF748 domain-containing protein n=1 Tax=Flavobacterium pallidum TaxID=2172098 RepID=A0A2S1SGB4_9FLAO|nr:hypothetical protein [Flavobacterium pallidum]AWI25448.1 hypothetical protein HYN49_05785 [Flavobacterium pallidum]
MRILKKILIAVAALAVLLLLVNKGVNIWVNRKLPELLSDKNKTAYHIAYDSIKIDVWDGSIKVKGIRLTPKKAVKDTVNKAGIYARIESVEVKDFSSMAVLFSNKIKARSITVNKPEIVFYKKTDNAMNSSKSIGSEVVKPFESIVTVSDLYLNHGDVKIIYVKNNKPVLNAANINIKLEGITVSDDILKRTIPFDYKTYSFSCDSLYFKNNAVYHIKAKNIQTETNGLSLKDFEMVPEMTRRQFVAYTPIEKDLYTLKAAGLDIRKMDWGFKDGKLYFSADALVLDKVNANIYRSKEPVDRPTPTHLYNRMLRDVTFPLRVDTLKLKDSDIVYEEEISFEKGPGKISFNKFNLTALNIKSDEGHDKMADVKIRMHCLFMNASPMKVDWNFNVLDKTDGFNIKGSILNFNIKNLVSFTKNYSNMMQEGVFDEVYFNINGNDIESKGEFAMKYHDVKVALYKKKDPNKKNKLKTAIANLLVKNDSKDKVKNVAVSVKRNPKTSFYNFFWLNIQEGLKKILI